MDLDGDEAYKLVTPLNIKDLLQGAEFELEDNKNDIVNTEISEEQIADDADFITHCRREMLGPDESEVTEENKDMQPFEYLGLQMTDVVPEQGELWQIGWLKKRLISQGNGSLATVGSLVKLHYNIYVENNDKPIDSSYLQGCPKGFQVGENDAIMGLELAVKTMSKGERSQFLVHNALYLGPIGCPPRVPANIDYFMFEVTLLDITERAHDVITYFSLPYRERQVASMELTMNVVNIRKKEAKVFFNQKNYHKAANKYCHLLNILEEKHLADEEEERIQQKELLRLYNNVALCYLLNKENYRVITFANKALELQRNDGKALYYKGKALRQQGEHFQAQIWLRKAMKVSPNEKEILKEMEIVKTAIMKQKNCEKTLYNKMFLGGKTSDVSVDETALSDLSVSDDFIENIELYFIDFVNDELKTECPFPPGHFSEHELEVIADVASKYKLRPKPDQKSCVFEKEK